MLELTGIGHYSMPLLPGMGFVDVDYDYDEDGPVQTWSDILGLNYFLLT
jgi:hypothetical protein